LVGLVEVDLSARYEAWAHSCFGPEWTGEAFGYSRPDADFVKPSFMTFIPEQFKRNLGELVHGDFYWIDVLLKDGKVHKGLTSNGEKILGAWVGMGSGSPDAPPGFSESEIRRIRPHSFWPFKEQWMRFFAP